MIRQPDDRAVQLFIKRSMIVRIASLSPKGNADVIPLWFLADRGRIYMATRSENPVARDIMTNPEAGLLFHGERGPRKDRVLRIRGSAAWRTDPALLRRIQIRAAARYYLTPGGMWDTIKSIRKLPVWTRYHQERGGGGLIEVTPETAEFLRAP